MKVVIFFVVAFIAVALSADPPLPQVASDYTLILKSTAFQKQTLQVMYDSDGLLRTNDLISGTSSVEIKSENIIVSFNGTVCNTQCYNNYSCPPQPYPSCMVVDGSLFSYLSNVTFDGTCDKGYTWTNNATPIPRTFCITKDNIPLWQMVAIGGMNVYTYYSDFVAGKPDGSNFVIPDICPCSNN